MKRLLARGWRTARRRMGDAGLLAIALLGASLALGLWLDQLHRRGDELAGALAEQRQRAALRALPGPVQKSAADMAAEVVAGLPTLVQSSSDLETVFAMADKSHLMLSKGEYRLKRDPNAAVLSYTITFPLRGEYGALKDFIVDVMGELPHVSMDELRLSRADAGSVVIDATVRFAFAYRAH